ncbi:hypothetical protein HMI54_015582, partial [Coelomomyces lativittatus]
MNSLLVLLFLFLLASTPAFISVNSAGVQTSYPLRFLYANEELEFGPFKVKTQFDIQTPSGEISDNDFAKKLDSVARELTELFEKHANNPFMFQTFLNTENKNFIQKNHQAIKSYLMSVKKYVSEIVSATMCNCKEGTCKFEGSTNTGGQTYTERLILFAYGNSPQFIFSHNHNMFNHCNSNSANCVVEAIRNTRPNREIENSPRSGSNLENVTPKGGSENSKDSNLNGNNEGSMAISVFREGPSFITTI